MRASNMKTKKNIQEQTVEKKTGFIRRFFKWLWRKKWWLLVITAVCVTLYLILGGGKKEKEQFAMANITRGDIRHVVTATGEIQPVNTVNIGSQVSGTIEKLYVDFNTKVKKGDKVLDFCTGTGIIPI